MICLQLSGTSWVSPPRPTKFLTGYFLSCRQTGVFRQLDRIRQIQTATTNATGLAYDFLLFLRRPRLGTAREEGGGGNKSYILVLPFLTNLDSFPEYFGVDYFN